MSFQTYPALDQIYDGSALHQERLRILWSRVRERETVVSIGCNSASGAAKFAPTGVRVYGVDLSPVALAASRSRVTPICADGARLPFRTAAVDVVMLGNVLEYVPDPAAVVAEAVRVARRTVVGTTPHEESYWGRSWFEAGQPVKRVDWGREMPVRYLTAEELTDLGFMTLDVLFDKTKPAYHVFSK